MFVRQPCSDMNLLRKHKLSLIGIAVGAVAGFLYYRFVGCSSGGCMISSNPFISTIYGSVMGFLLFNSFSSTKKETAKTDNHENENNH